MGYTPKQDDIEILYQQKVNIYIKINLLDKTLKIIDNLQGELIENDYTIDAESDIRRTFNLTMFVKDSSFLIGKNTKIWIDKYIEIQIGLKNQRTEEIFYYPMGIYLFNEIGYEYNPTTKNLSLSCVDLMAQFTGLRNGQVMGLTTEIPEGSDIRNSIIKTITQLGNYTKYRVDSREKKRDGIINLFDIENSNNNLYNCSLQKIDYQTYNIVASIPPDETYASVKYYNTIDFKQGKTYTFSFITESNISNSKIELIIFGKRTDENTYQSITSKNGDSILTFTIDNEFTKIEYFDIRIANIPIKETDNEDEALTNTEIVYENILIYEGSYNKDNLPEYVSYNREQIVPYDLTFTTGSTVYDILTKLNDLESGWEMFFDTDGTFINQKIPTTENDSYVLDWETIERLVISESMESNFSDVKNSTRVWGKCLDADRTVEEVVTNENEYEITLDYLIPSGNEDIPYGTLIALKVNTNNVEDMKIKVTDNKANPQVNNGETTYTKFEASYPIVDSGDISILPDSMIKGNYYVVKYRSKKFYLIGQFQVVYVVKEYNILPLKEGQSKEEWIKEDKEKEGTENVKYIINSESENITEDMTEEEIKSLYNPFAIDEIGEIRQVLSGGDYENIYTDDLARQRAEYENWKSMRLNITLTLEMKPVLWLDVNQKIQYKSKITGEIEEYIIKSINGSTTSGTMTINATKFYPLYPFVVEE